MNTMNDLNQTVDEHGRKPIPAVSDEPNPAYVGRYRIEKVLGKGGFGVVYLAHDDQLQRLVAIKVPHRRLVDRPEAAEPYLAEARTVANLDHPNIVPVHDIGMTVEFPCFIVSKYIDGSNLSWRIKQARLTLHESVELTATVAGALHHAHQQGLVHRDVKPGNILLDRSGKPFVADFGLALREQDIGKGPGYVGTRGYMSPEQARGEGHRVDRRSDVFSLGVVLYELLTGLRPNPAEGVDGLEEFLEHVERAAVRRPGKRDDGMPREVERICLKALAKRARDRYSTAADMAVDLRHFLDRSPKDTGIGASAVGSGQASGGPTLPEPASRAIKIVPKGLRSFDVHDADFFLELLPGPRDREGLPDSIRFWKNLVEERDADQTFAVGLIYGPSGCGKSSLVKAGLLPRLDKDVIAVYVEATALETEARLVNGLRKRLPALSSHQGLTETLTALRRGQGIPAGKKVLILLDQFEQWLHAQAGREPNRSQTVDAELVRALRQCDGSRVQCIVMVRDDFWLAVSRFLRELEVQLLEGQNSALVDLFDTDHAKNVLAAFGRAFGKLPESSRETSKEQNQFLEQAVAELSQEGKVICVRLALFAEMMKNKTWTPASLKAVGGAAGVGVAFLEETFSAATAPPKHRYHQQAARGVLKALSPETGANIKGHMRSQQELLASSGYESHPKDFADLLRILDGEIRLITPTDPEGSEDSSSQVQPGDKYYQLTHDYLVPSLRDWLSRKQKETRRGRAEMLLADRAHAWNARPEKRQLPGLTEWLSIRLLTTPRTWTDGQRQMMRAAASKHVVGVGRLLAVVVLLVIGGLFFREQLAEERAAARADGTVRRLLDAKVAETPAIIDELAKHRRWADPLLENVVADPAGRRDHQLHARLALLPVDPSQAGPLFVSLLEADAQEFPIIRDALMPIRDGLVNDLWALLESGEVDPRRRFRAAAALARYDPSTARWEGSQRWVAEHLVAEPSLVLPRWVDALRPVKDRLLPALAVLLRERSPSAAGSAVVAEVIGDYAADQPRVLAQALANAPLSSFAILFPRLQAQSMEAAAALTALLDKLPPDDGPSANETASQRANLAIALLRLGAGERLWPLLKASENPRARSFAIDRMAALGCQPDVLLARLDVEPDDIVRAALWLSLGGFDEMSLPATRRATLTPKVLDAHRRDGSAAVHAATRWLLDKWGARGSAPSAAAAADKNRHWYVNGAGHTMVRITGPVDFLIGAHPDEPGRSDYEKRHPTRIPYSYDIGMTEVTVGQFRRFLEKRGSQDLAAFDARQARLSPDAAVTRVGWYDAVAYCNWLSAEENIPSNQWCYEPRTDGAFGEGMAIAKNWRNKTGYRLPTEAEWEYACRGGAATSRCYGDADALLPRYAWYAANAGDEPAPVARLLPNAFGLFDMHGNTGEWCQDVARPYEDRFQADAEAEIVSSLQPRSVRGGSMFVQARALRSSKRFADRPTTTDAPGFRIARSRP